MNIAANMENAASLMAQATARIQQLEADKLELCQALESAMAHIRALNEGNEYLSQVMAPFHDVWKKHDPEWQQQTKELRAAGFNVTC